MSVITTNALMYKTRMAGISVSFATNMDEMGAKSADRFPAMMIQE